MPDYRRADIPGGTYFFTVNTYQRAPLLVQPPVRVALREAIDNVRASQPFTIKAWVLLPDHLHCVWTLPANDSNFSKRWGMIKRHVSRQCKPLAPLSCPSRSRLARREISFWQRRYWEHLIQDEADFKKHVDYIHWNPVKHGLVRQVADWPYSSFHRYVQNDAYAADWGIAQEHEGHFGER